MPAQAGEAETWACAHVRRRKAWYSLARAKATQGSLGARAPFRLRKRAAPRHVQQTASRRPSSPTVPLAQRAASSCAASHRRSRYEQDASEPRRAFATAKVRRRTWRTRRCMGCDDFAWRRRRFTGFSGD